LFVPSLVLAVFAGYRFWNGNLAAVQEGRIYRSSQLAPTDLATVLRQQRIKTVLNLRGPNPTQEWYRSERRATAEAGVTQVDIAMSSREWMSRDQLRALVGVLDECEYPLLIHCWRGAERTGLVSAFTELLRPGGSLARARSQFSVHYLYVPIGGGAMMPKHLDQYESWLNAQGQSHTPARFRQWVASGYRPGSPSREEWPYDPYPLVVRNHPQ
jgi:protein tyrosine phosphatase (PTP) superfamily phosphohydrolase (DUF442 family)